MKIANRFRSVAVLAALALITHATFDQTFAVEPIKVGFSMALTGAFAGNGKAALRTIRTPRAGYWDVRSH